MNINEYLVGDNIILLNEIDKKINLVYIDPPFGTGRDFYYFNDKWKNIPDFIEEFIKPRIEIIYEKLDPNGTLIIHIDSYASHYIKVLLDKIFNLNNFRNEIVWVTTGNKKSKDKLQRSHDTLLVYSKSKKYTFNQLYLPYDKEYRASNNIKTDQRGEYVTTAAHNSQPDVIKRENLRYEWNGHVQQWWCGIDRMTKLHEEDRLVYNKKGIPRIKRYLNEMQGIPIRDVWQDIGSIQSPEKTEYATQKPLKLLERIVNMYSNENDIVLDCFAGSGTTGIACKKLKRNYILIDINDKGKEVFGQRLKNMENPPLTPAQPVV